MKEYTYTNKAYLGIKEGVVPPAPQYLWLNSKDDKLYKFGNNGWEVTNNAPYIVEDFTVGDIITQSAERSPQLTISRPLLDAMYKGVPIMVKATLGQGATMPIDVTSITDPSQYTSFHFNVKRGSIQYNVSGRGPVLSGNASMKVTVTTYNSVDWNENGSNTTGYIANRTHYLIAVTTFTPGQRISVAIPLATNDIEDYRIKIGENLYKLPKTINTVKIGDDGKNFDIQLIDISQSDNILMYTYNTSNPTGFSGEICAIHRWVRPLDPVYLQNEALTWNYRGYAPVSSLGGSSRFNTGNTVNQLYNKDLYMINASTVEDKFSIEIGVEHNKPDSAKEYKFIVANNKTEISPTVSFVDGIGYRLKPQIKVIGNSSPNCEIHVKIIAYGDMKKLAIIEYKPFN